MVRKKKYRMFPREKWEKGRKELKKKERLIYNDKTRYYYEIQQRNSKKRRKGQIKGLYKGD